MWNDTLGSKMTIWTTHELNLPSPLINSKLIITCAEFQHIPVILSIEPVMPQDFPEILNTELLKFTTTKKKKKRCIIHLFR